MISFGFFFSSRRRHTSCALVTGVQTCALPILGLHVIVTHHDADYERANWGAFAKLTLRLGERSALICAHRVIAVSPSLASQLTLLFPSHAYKVTYRPDANTSELQSLMRNSYAVLCLYKKTNKSNLLNQKL